MRLRAGKQGLQLAVRWYYVAENENIAEWIMGGELVFITGINHPRDEDNLIHLLMEGKQRGIAGMVILTGDAYIQAIPSPDRTGRRAGHSADRTALSAKDGDCHRTHRHCAGAQ